MSLTLLVAIVSLLGWIAVLLFTSITAGATAPRRSPPRPPPPPP
jgi:hypothetical protein